jgi:type II secretory pathway pseudopilin PulG
MKQRGLTIIEMLTIVVMIGIAAAIFLPAIFGDRSTSGSTTWGINGTTESRCIEGYKFVVDTTGNARQILDEYGKGVRCDR